MDILLKIIEFLPLDDIITLKGIDEGLELACQNQTIIRKIIQKDYTSKDIIFGNIFAIMKKKKISIEEYIILKVRETVCHESKFF